MKQKFILFTAVALCSITLTFYSCKDKTKDPAPTTNTPINTDSCKNITYTTSISAIVSSNCTGSCHIPGNISGGLLLNSKTAVENAIKNNNLLGRIKSTNNPMPPSGLMKDSTIKKFDCWKTKGYLN